jgi:ribonuclease VapC
LIAIDTSAILAIVFGEPERERFAEIVEQSDKILISTVSVVEAKMVVHGRRGMRGVIMVQDMIDLPQFEITPPTEEDMEVAFTAFLAFGKGSGHPAALNFGDVFVYALAKVRDLPLLFKGKDFAETDLRPVVTNYPLGDPRH